MSGFDWFNECDYAVTVCDKNGIIVYQNIKAVKTFEKYGSVIGKNLKDCHSIQSWEKIENMISSGESNTYTIEKRGSKKLIHQTPWKENGVVMGLIEVSIELPSNMPHFIRE
jgi:DUF438 domain-containing protein